MGTYIRDLFDLTGQVAIVTGGTRNLGHDAAEALAGHAGVVAVGAQLEITGEQAWTGLVDSTLQRFGRLDIVVNNAGGRTVLIGKPDPNLDAAACFPEDRPLDDGNSFVYSCQNSWMAPHDQFIMRVAGLGPSRLTSSRTRGTGLR
jgi:NAD(P)-dependent dehydrogenase (short-subunit alcohol dehydrogenase family)